MREREWVSVSGRIYEGCKVGIHIRTRSLSCIIISIAILLLITLTTSPPAIAVSLSDQHYTHTFSDDNEWDYVSITRDDPNVNATGEIWFWEGNLTVKIVETNIKNATVHTGEILNLTGLSVDDISGYLALVGRLTVIVSGSGTDKFIIENVPEIARLYIDGSLSSNYTWEDNNLTIQLQMSEHELILDFSYNDQIDSVTMIIANVFLPTVLILVLVVSVGRGIWRLRK